MGPTMVSQLVCSKAKEILGDMELLLLPQCIAQPVLLGRALDVVAPADRDDANLLIMALAF